MLFCTNSWRRRVFFVLLYFLRLLDFFWDFYHFLDFLHFCTFCTFLLCHLVGQSIWISMQNLESVAQKMAELWVLLYFLYFCILFGLSIRTFMQNLDYVAQKMSELCSIYYLAAILFFLITQNLAQHNINRQSNGIWISRNSHGCN